MWLNVWDGLKNKICRYLLQRYLGRFLDDKLRLEQFKVELYNGKAKVQNVVLNVDALNELLHSQGWGIKVVGGHIGELIVTVPWNALMINNSSIEITNLVIRLQPIQRHSNGASMVESMWCSLSSSMQLAEECFKQDLEITEKYSHSTVQAIDGLEKFAETIDNVLNRITAKFTNTFIRLEKYVKHNGAYLCLHTEIKDFYYKNESGVKFHSPHSEGEEKKNIKHQQIHLLPTFAKHSVECNGIKMFTEEYSKNINECCALLLPPNPNHMTDSLIPFLEVKGIQKVIIQVKQLDEINGPKILLDLELGAIHSMLTPRQMHIVLSFWDSYCAEEPQMQNSKEMAFKRKIEKCETEKPFFEGALNESLMWAESAENNSNESSMTRSSRAEQQKLGSVISCGDIFKFNIRIACCALHVLHEDITTDSSFTSKKSTLSELCNNFFNEWEDKFGEKTMLSLAQRNHIFVFLSPIVLEGIQQRNENVLLLKISGTSTKMNIDEVFQGRSQRIVMSHQKKSCLLEHQRRPDIMFEIKSTSSHIESLNKLSWDVKIEESLLEVDISIYDRLSALVGSSPFSQPTHCTCSMTSNEQINKLSTEVNIVWKFVQINLRFPISDARQLENLDAQTGWKQNIQQDFLQLDIFQLRCRCADLSYEFYMDSMDLYYCESQMSRVHFFRANGISSKPNFGEQNIRVTISLQPHLIYSQVPTKLTPFSTQRLCRQSDTAHEKKDFAEAETILLPGNNDELQLFSDSTMEKSAVQIKIYLPNLKIVFESKQLYEILYSRLNYNILLWQPKTPLLDVHKLNPASSPETTNFSTNALQKNFKENKLEDNHKKLQRNEENILGNKVTDRFVKQSLKDAGINKNNSWAIDITVHKGMLNFLLPVRDEANCVTSNQAGRADLMLTDLQLFFVNDFSGTASLDYLSLRAKQFEMYHCGIIPENYPKPSYDINEIPSFMTLTICNASIGLNKEDRVLHVDRDMVSLAMEIKKSQGKNIKRIRATTAFEAATLHYKTQPLSELWISQFIDFFDVQDPIIDGYEPFAVLTEMQFHVLNFAVSYRPENFPFQVVVETGMFSIGSNVTSTSKGCNLRCILEDFVLEIGKNIGHADSSVARKNPSQVVNFVPVCDIALFDVSIRLNNGISHISPGFDLRCSIHDANLRTCADSGQALAHLISYIVSGNDFESQNTDDKSGMFRSVTTTLSEEGVYQNFNEKQHNRVSKLMADAVQDTEEKPESVFKLSTEIHEKEFWLPRDAGNQEYLKEHDEHKAYDLRTFEHDVMSQICQPKSLISEGMISFEQKDFVAAVHSRDQKKLFDEEYCFVLEGNKLFATDQSPTVKVLAEPLQIVDNHFPLPSDTADLLSPPDKFPMAVSRYTVCEMTFTWHIYGGKDFPEQLVNPKENKHKQAHTMMSEAYSHGVSQAKTPHNVKSFSYSKENLTWKSKGGPERNHNVVVQIFLNKIRFSHEIYPTHTSQASRQVFLVNEIEIRDRLQASEINKLLYHPNVNNLSNKTNRNMLVIKALHIRTNSRQEAEEECSLRISLLPLRLHIDQETLIFLVEYFTNINDRNSNVSNDAKEECISNKLEKKFKKESPTLEVKELDGHELNANYVNDDISLICNALEENAIFFGGKNNKQCLGIKKYIYFRDIVFSPEVSIRLDYHGRRVELSRGPIAGLLLGFGQLRCSEVRLREIVYRRGLLGLERLLTYMCTEWLRDIKRHQLPSILSGVGPAYPFIQLFNGIYDLFRMPYEQYQKDGRVIRGIQLGAQSFTARTALAALEITSRVIYLLQITAETAFEMVSYYPSAEKYGATPRDKKQRPFRPKDIREGVANAYFILKEGINDSATNLIETASVEHDQKGYTGAVGAVMRHIPQLVVCPAVLATKATTNILGGAKNSLVPEAKLEAKEKWKGNDE